MRVDPQAPGAGEETTPTRAPRGGSDGGHLLDPWTGAAILGLDWLLFGSNLLSGMALTPVVIVVGAVTGFLAAYWAERHRARRPVWRSLLAAVFAAAVVGAPLPLGGTVVGGLVIALSGLPGGSR